MGKSKAIREMELAYKIKLARYDLFATIVRSFLPSAAVVIVAYLVTNSVNRLAGKFTFADIAVRFVSDWRIGISYTMTGLATGWALLERKLKGDHIARLSKRVVELEQHIDPRRTSSRLTARGTTRSGD